MSKNFLSKRFLSVVLALCMILTAVPGVFAEGTTDDSSGSGIYVIPGDVDPSIMLAAGPGIDVGGSGGIQVPEGTLQAAIDEAMKQESDNVSVIVTGSDDFQDKSDVDFAGEGKTITVISQDPVRLPVGINVVNGNLSLTRINIDPSTVESSAVTVNEGTIELHECQVTGGTDIAPFDVKGGSVTIAGTAGVICKEASTVAKFTGTGGSFNVNGPITCSGVRENWFVYGDSNLAPTKDNSATITVAEGTELDGYIVLDGEGNVVNITKTLQAAVTLAEGNGYNKIKVGSANVPEEGKSANVKRPLIVDTNGAEGIELNAADGMVVDSATGADTGFLYVVPAAAGIKDDNGGNVPTLTVAISEQGVSANDPKVVDITVDIGNANLSVGGAPSNAYWVGVGLIAPDGATKVDYNDGPGTEFVSNNTDGTLDVLHKEDGSVAKGLGYWFDAATLPEGDAQTFEVLWYNDTDNPKENPIGVYTYNVTLSKRPSLGGFLPKVTHLGYGETKEAAIADAIENFPPSYVKKYGPGDERGEWRGESGHRDWADHTMFVVFEQPIPKGLVIDVKVKTPDVSNNTSITISCRGNGQSCIFAWSFDNPNQIDPKIKPQTGEYSVEDITKNEEKTNEEGEAGKGIELGAWTTENPADQNLSCYVFGVGGMTPGFKASASEADRAIEALVNQNNGTNGYTVTSPSGGNNVMYVVFDQRIKVEDGKSITLTVHAPGEGDGDPFYTETVQGAEGKTAVDVKFNCDGLGGVSHSKTPIKEGTYTLVLTDGDDTVLAETTLTIEKDIYKANTADNPNGKFDGVKGLEQGDYGSLNEDSTQYEIYRDQKDDPADPITKPKNNGQFIFTGWDGPVTDETGLVNTYEAVWEDFAGDLKISEVQFKAKNAKQELSIADADINIMQVTLNHVNDKGNTDDKVINLVVTKDGKLIYNEAIETGWSKVYFRFPNKTEGIGSGDGENDTAGEYLAPGKYDVTLQTEDETVIGEPKSITLYEISYKAGDEGYFEEGMGKDFDLKYGYYSTNKNYITYISEDDYNIKLVDKTLLDYTKPNNPITNNPNNYFNGWRQTMENQSANTARFVADWGTYDGLKIGEVGFDQDPDKAAEKIYKHIEEEGKPKPTDVEPNTMYVALQDRFAPADGSDASLTVKITKTADENNKPLEDVPVFEQTVTNAKVIYFNFADEPGEDAGKPVEGKGSVAAIPLSEAAGKYEVRLYRADGQEIGAPMEYNISKATFDFQNGTLYGAGNEILDEKTKTAFVGQEEQLDFSKWDLRKSGYKFDKWITLPDLYEVTDLTYTAPKDNPEVKRYLALWQNSKLEILGVGYKEDAKEAQAAMQELVSKIADGAQAGTDVADRTLYVAFKLDDQNYSADGISYILELKKGDKVYTEELNGARKGGCFYESFDDQITDFAPYEGRYEFKIYPKGDLDSASYATLDIYKVGYDANGGEFETAPEDYYVMADDIETIPEADGNLVPTKDGSEFGGWSKPEKDANNFSVSYKASWVENTPAPSPEPSTEPSAEPSTEPSAEPSTEPSAEPSTEPSTEPSETPEPVESAAPSTAPSTEPTAAPTLAPISEDHLFISDNFADLVVPDGDNQTIPAGTYLDDYKIYSAKGTRYQTNKGKSVIDGTEYNNSFRVKNTQEYLEFVLDKPAKVTIYSNNDPSRPFTLGASIEEEGTPASSVSTAENGAEISVFDYVLPGHYYLTASGDMFIAGIRFEFDVTEPTPTPSEEPSTEPSTEPSETPEPVEPSATPTVEPSEEPTEAPATEAPATEAPATATPGPVESEEPTETPTVEPSEEPSATPTVEPSEAPTIAPTATPTTAPTATPTSGPVTPPTATPTVAPTETPTAAPTETPTVEPTEEPGATPTAEPSTEPSVEPTAEPSSEPTATPTPTATRRPSHSSGGYGGGGGSFGTGNSAATPTPTVTPAPGTTPVPGATNAPGTPGTPGSGQVFEDVPADYWAYDYIMDLYYAGIINGETPTMFVPEGNVTRAEFAKMAVLVFGLSNTATESKFEDVAPDDWFAPYVIAATEAGIVLGTSETTYSPNDTITREQIAAIIGRQLNAASENPSGYGDSADIEAYALPYVTGLSEQGILTGDNGVFRPKDYSTRAEAATIIDRVRTR